MGGRVLRKRSHGKDFRATMSHNLNSQVSCERNLTIPQLYTAALPSAVMASVTPWIHGLHSCNMSCDDPSKMHVHMRVHVWPLRAHGE